MNDQFTINEQLIARCGDRQFEGSPRFHDDERIECANPHCGDKFVPENSTDHTCGKMVCYRWFRIYGEK